MRPQLSQRRRHDIVRAAPNVAIAQRLTEETDRQRALARAAKPVVAAWFKPKVNQMQSSTRPKHIHDSLYERGLSHIATRVGMADERVFDTIRDGWHDYKAEKRPVTRADPWRKRAEEIDVKVSAVPKRSSSARAPPRVAELTTRRLRAEACDREDRKRALSASRSARDRPMNATPLPRVASLIHRQHRSCELADTSSARCASESVAVENTDVEDGSDAAA